MEEIQGWDKWAEKYKPIKNKFSSDPDATMFETYDAEWEFIKEQDPRYVWTWITGDMSDLIVAGRAFVNRFGYYVTEVPWDDEDEYVLLSVEAECECYKEEGYGPNAFGYYDDGDPECDKCEGYGLVTTYVE
jgi:hypothetical protein